MTTVKRKLIEVSLPLEKINSESAREKSIRHGHPSTLHLWWARRPLAAARAVLFAQLVDDPSSRPDEFPTEEAQRIERERLHGIIERLVVWENARDETLLAEARREISNSTADNPPTILDPFAGGGTIPLEAQRLGLEVRASDLNPVAVLINKALVEIPPKFVDKSPVFPGRAETKFDWPGATGLAADVYAYGDWMRIEAQRRLGQHYPTAKLPDGTHAIVIAWIWARTVKCPNPACGIEMPLVRSWWLGKKKGKEVWIRPVTVPEAGDEVKKRVNFEIHYGTAGAPTRDDDGTAGRNGATCTNCRSAVDLEYVRTEARAGRTGTTLLAVAAKGSRGRLYLEATDEHRRAAEAPDPVDAPDALLPPEALGFRVQRYGLTRWADLYTPRQLYALTTLSDLVIEARERVLADSHSDEAYADAVATYLAMHVSRQADLGNSLCGWDPSVECPHHLLGLPAIPMLWDFAEGNPLGDSSGSWQVLLNGSSRAFGSVAFAPLHTKPAVVSQGDAAVAAFDNAVISTDPPYYDNIGYSDLSDFFYIWIRRSLRQIYPDLLGTMLVPKAEELVANPFRHDGKEGAQRFFEEGFRRVFARARASATSEFPITVYYAFKQSQSDSDGTASTGWETLLAGMIGSGWEITGTWPVRSEASNRRRSMDSNALASSIVLVLRPRPENAPDTDRRGLIAALHAELPEALRRLQQGAIAPVDLPQAAIGPGMAVFSRYSRVLEGDGSPMTVRSALARINEILDQVLNEQEGDFDTATRFAIAWYRQHGYNRGEFGVADNLARARNTSVEAVAREGIITSAAGKVRLRDPSELPEDYDVITDDRVGVWEVLHHLIARTGSGGVQAAGLFLSDVQARTDAVDLELVKELAFLLFHLAEGSGWTQDALQFNNVATSWHEIIDASHQAPVEVQLGLDIAAEG